MESTTLMEKNAIVLENLAGTKWVGWTEMYCEWALPHMMDTKVSVEFLDKTNCIYTSESNKYSMTYIVMGGKLFLNDIKRPFILRGNILFNGNIPAFQKVV